MPGFRGLQKQLFCLSESYLPHDLTHNQSYLGGKMNFLLLSLEFGSRYGGGKSESAPTEHPAESTEPTS